MVDYKDVLLTLVPAAPRTQHLCSFLCELSLLHTSLAVYAPARLAAAALLLARLMHGQSKDPALRWLLSGGSARAWGSPELGHGMRLSYKGEGERQSSMPAPEQETQAWTVAVLWG